MRRTGFVAVALTATAVVPAAGGAEQDVLPVVYFSTAEGGAADVYVNTGDDEHSVVASAGHDCGPALSRSGRLAFASTRGVGVRQDPLNWDLYLQEAPASDPVQLTATPDQLELFPAWSPDEEWIAFMRLDPNGAVSIWKMRPDPANLDEQRLTFPTSGTSHNPPAWSPDGTRIAFAVGSGPSAGPVSTVASIWVMNADGTDQRLLIEDAADPTWHPDGGTIAFSNLRGRIPGFPSIGAIDFDPETGMVDPSSRRVLVDDPAAMYQPAYSPDGDLAFVRDPDGGMPAVLALPDGTSRDVWVGGPHPADIWVLGETTARTSGTGSGHPVFAPFPGWWGS